MDDSTFRMGLIGIAALLYSGVVGYSVFGYGRSGPRAGAGTEGPVRPPAVIYHDDDVDVYSSRTIRSSGTRGGGIRGGK